MWNNPFTEKENQLFRKVRDVVRSQTSLQNCSRTSYECNMSRCVSGGSRPPGRRFCTIQLNSQQMCNKYAGLNVHTERNEVL